MDSRTDLLSMLAAPYLSAGAANDVELLNSGSPVVEIQGDHRRGLAGRWVIWSSCVANLGRFACRTVGS